jgi:transglutaminase/protease-like cytokinesis protein 3
MSNRLSILFVLLILIANEGFSQSVDENSFKRIDSVLTYIIPLEQKLCDSAKASLIFKWISENIDYDYLLADTSILIGLPDTWNKLTRNLETLLLKKKGVCNGISYLYYLLCKHAGLKVVDVLGEVKGYKKDGNFLFMMSYPHTWNMVYWNNRWHQIDCTWGLASEKFSEIDWFWFDTKPEFFFLSHYAYKQSLNVGFTQVSKQKFQLFPYFDREYFNYFQINKSMVYEYVNEKSTSIIFFSKPKQDIIPYMQKMVSCNYSSDVFTTTLEELNDSTWRQINAEKNACYSIAIKIKVVEIFKENDFEMVTVKTIYDLARIGVLHTRM